MRFCQGAVTVLGGPERQVLGWVVCGPKKLDFNQVNRMEKKDFCTAECCTGGLRPPAHPSSDTCRWRGQQAPSAPTPDRYRDHWSKAGWSGLVWEADLDPVEGSGKCCKTFAMACDRQLSFSCRSARLSSTIASDRSFDSAAERY